VVDAARSAAQNPGMAARAGQLSFCETCDAEVLALPNTHRARNTAAANFAAANLALVATGVRKLGPTGRYVCPLCGDDVTARRAERMR
jgi:hypothetical protein